MKIFFIFALMAISVSLNAQTVILNQNDTTLSVEYRNGVQWAYREHNNLVLGVANVITKDDYGKYYQIHIYIKNLGETAILFQPEKITSLLVTKKDKEKTLVVYTYEQYMRKIERKQELEMALSGFAVGMNAAMAGNRTAHVSGWAPKTGFYSGTVHYYDYGAATAAQIAGYSYLDNLERDFNSDQVIKSQGYLRITSVRPGEEIVGYINIKKKKGKILKLFIPIENYKYFFNWKLDK